MNTRALLLSLAGGTILQVVMVVAGHSDKRVMKFFAVGGMGLSLLAGLAYGFLDAGQPTAALLRGGAVAGGGCALLGIAVSYFLGDVPVSLLLLGTASSAVTGAIGGAIAPWLTRIGWV